MSGPQALSVSVLEDSVLGVFVDFSAAYEGAVLSLDDLQREWGVGRLRALDLSQATTSLIEATILEPIHIAEGAALRLTSMGAAYFEAGELGDSRRPAARRLLKRKVDRLRAANRRRQSISASGRRNRRAADIGA